MKSLHAYRFFQRKNPSTSRVSHAFSYPFFLCAQFFVAVFALLSLSLSLSLSLVSKRYFSTFSRKIRIFSILLVGISSIGTMAVSHAIDYPSVPPTNEPFGGTFYNWFTHIFGSCPDGSVLVGFESIPSDGSEPYKTTAGTKICKPSLAAGLTDGLKGTEGYLPKYTANGTGFTNSVVYETGARIGIGTNTSLGESLDVNGAIRIMGASAGTPTNSLSGAVLIRDNADRLTNSSRTVLGTSYTSGGPVLGYGVVPSTTAANQFTSSTSNASSSNNIARSALTLDGSGMHVFVGSAQNPALGQPTNLSEAMQIQNNGNGIFYKNLTVSGELISEKLTVRDGATFSGNMGISSGDLVVNSGKIAGKKGIPTSGDSSHVGFSFEQDGDTGMFASGGVGSNSSILSFYNDNVLYMGMSANSVKIAQALTVSGATTFASGVTVSAGNLNVTSGKVTAKKGAPLDSDNSSVGFSFAGDGDTGMFASGGSNIAGSDLNFYNGSTLLMSLPSNQFGVYMPKALTVNGATNLQTTTTGPLTVNGITNLNNNVFIKNGDLIIGSGGTIAFANEENVPWAPKNSNLPFFKFGGLGFIRPQIIGSFAGQVILQGPFSYFFYERDGALVGLRSGYNGEYDRLFYMYSQNGRLADMILTSQEYHPAFLDILDADTGKHWNVVQGMDGNANSMSLRVCDVDDFSICDDKMGNTRSDVAINEHTRYYLLYNITTMDGAAHTMEHAIDITDHTLFPYKACQYIPEKNMILCVGRKNSQSLLYLYSYSGGVATPIAITPAVSTPGSASNVVFDANSAGALDGIFIQKSGTYTAYQTSNSHRNAVTVAYQVVGNTLYVHYLLSIYAPNTDGNPPIQKNGNKDIAKTFSLNLIYRINIDPSSPDYGHLGYENNLPIEVDWNQIGYDWNVVGANDSWSIPKQSFDQMGYRWYFFPGKNQVLAGVGYQVNPNVNGIEVSQFDGIPDMLSFWKGFTSRNVVYLGAQKIVATKKTLNPFSASYLGTWIKFARFIGEKRMIMISNSNKYLEGSGERWIQADVPSLTPDRIIDNIPVLPILENVTLIDTMKSRIKHTTIDPDGNIVGYAIDSNKIYKYTSVDDQMTAIATLPSNYRTQINADIQSIENWSDPVYGEPVNNRANNEVVQPRILSDNRILVPYSLFYKGATDTYYQKMRIGYILYSYSATGGLTLMYSQPDIYTSTSLGSYKGAPFLEDSATYIAKDGSIYVGFLLIQVSYLGNSSSMNSYLHLASDGTLLEKSPLTLHATGPYIFYTLGIHPTYGLYGTNYYHKSYTYNTLFSYCAPHCPLDTIADIDARMIASYQSAIASSTNNYGTASPNTIIATIRNTEGFTIYTTRTPLYLGGIATALGDAQYDLTDPVYGLVTIAGDTTPLQNTTIYVSIDPKSDVSTPRLAFGYMEPGDSPVLAIITTTQYGLKNIITKNGFDITSDSVSVKTIRVSGSIELRGEDGRWYRIYVDSSGSLRSTLIPE